MCGGPAQQWGRGLKPRGASRRPQWLRGLRRAWSRSSCSACSALLCCSAELVLICGDKATVRAGAETSVGRGTSSGQHAGGIATTAPLAFGSFHPLLCGICSSQSAP